MPHMASTGTLGRRQEAGGSARPSYCWVVGRVLTLHEASTDHSVGRDQAILLLLGGSEGPGFIFLSLCQYHTVLMTVALYVSQLRIECSEMAIIIHLGVRNE